MPETELLLKQLDYLEQGDMATERPVPSVKKSDKGCLPVWALDRITTRDCECLKPFGDVWRRWMRCVHGRGGSSSIPLLDYNLCKCFQPTWVFYKFKDVQNFHVYRKSCRSAIPNGILWWVLWNFQANCWEFLTHALRDLQLNLHWNEMFPALVQIFEIFIM